MLNVVCVVICIWLVLYGLCTQEIPLLCTPLTGKMFDFILFFQFYPSYIIGIIPEINKCQIRCEITVKTQLFFVF